MTRKTTEKKTPVSFRLTPKIHDEVEKIASEASNKDLTDTVVTLLNLGKEDYQKNPDSIPQRLSGRRSSYNKTIDCSEIIQLLNSKIGQIQNTIKQPVDDIESKSTESEQNNDYKDRKLISVRLPQDLYEFISEVAVSRFPKKSQKSGGDLSKAITSLIIIGIRVHSQGEVYIPNLPYDRRRNPNILAADELFELMEEKLNFLVNLIDRWGDKKNRQKPTKPINSKPINNNTLVNQGIFQKVQMINQNQSNPDIRNHKIRLDMMNNLAHLYQKMGRYLDGKQICLQALDMLENRLGEDHPDSIEILNTLALIYIKMSESNTLEKEFYLTCSVNECYKKIEAILENKMGINPEKNKGTSHPLYLQNLKNLAIVYSLFSDENDQKEAIKLYKQIGKILVENIGTDTVGYAENLINQSLVYEKMGDYHQALEICQSAKEILAKNQFSEHQLYLETLNIMALITEAMGNYWEAESLLREALELTPHRSLK